MLREYFCAALSLCVFISVAIGVAHTRLKKAVSFGAGILIICSIMLPLVDVLRNFDVDDVFDKILADVDYDGATDDSIELAFESGIAEYIAEKYTVETSSILVNADGFDMATLRAERIYVTLSGEAIRLDYKRIENEIRDQFTYGGECEVSINVKG